MNDVAFPAGFSLASLPRSQPRPGFDCGQTEVNDWLRTRAFQHQEQRLSSTEVLLDQHGRIAGYYALTTGQVDFGDLPSELACRQPRRALPAAILAWQARRSTEDSVIH